MLSRQMLATLIGLATIGMAHHAIAQEPPAAPPPAEARGPVLNLNTASVADLEQLPGIGASMAARIVEYRQKHGPFKKVEDLMNVKGIGEKGFLKLKPLLTVSGSKSTSTPPRADQAER